MQRPQVITSNGTSYDADIIEQSPHLDLALLKIRIRNAPFLEMGNANDLYPGQNIITIGNPGGLSFSVTKGIVSAVGRNIQGVSYIQTDAAINPGNSGGPMISEDFKVVAVNTLTSRRDQNISFSLPINYAYASGGIIDNLGQAPAGRPPFKDADDPVQTAFQGQRDDSGPSLPTDVYEKEVNQLRAEYNKKVAEIQQQYQDYLAEIGRLQDEIDNPNLPLFQKERRREEIEEINEKIGKLNDDASYARLRLIRQVISVLQRQKGDSRFRPYGGQIQAQIDKLTAEARSLEQKL